jgi:hypothetical protein
VVDKVHEAEMKLFGSWVYFVFMREIKEQNPPSCRIFLIDIPEEWGIRKISMCENLKCIGGIAASFLICHGISSTANLASE